MTTVPSEEGEGGHDMDGILPPAPKKKVSALEDALRSSITRAHKLNTDLSSLSRVVNSRAGARGGAGGLSYGPGGTRAEGPGGGRDRPRPRHPPTRPLHARAEAEGAGDDTDDDMDMGPRDAALASTVSRDVDRRRLELAVMDDSHTTKGDGSRDGRADTSKDWNKDKVLDARGNIDRRKEMQAEADTGTGTGTGTATDTDTDDRDRARDTSRDRARDTSRDRARARDRDEAEDDARVRRRRARSPPDKGDQRSRRRAPPGHDLRGSGVSRDRRRAAAVEPKVKAAGKGKDAKAAGRNKRIVGLLTSALKQHSKEMAAAPRDRGTEQARLQIAERKRVELDRQIRQDAQSEKDRLREMINEKRELNEQIRRLMEEKDKALATLKRRLRLAFHIQTEAEPPIHWLPKEHTQATRDLLDQQREAIEWEEGEEADLVRQLEDEHERLHPHARTREREEAEGGGG